MVKPQVIDISNAMKNPKNIRNISIIAHVDHGKTTSSDSLVNRAGIIGNDQTGNALYMDTTPEEQAKGITIKSTGISLLYQLEEFNNQHFLINLIDSPGHVDFSAEVTSALRVTDGALVIVDAVENVAVQTETVLRQALGERVKPVLMINKIDRLILELQMTPEECYQKFVKVIENVNVVISVYDDEALQVEPYHGTVAFASAKQGWGFSLSKFAKIYGKKFGVNEDKMIKKLWGDNYFDPESKKWVKEAYSKSGKPLQRGFCQFIMQPIMNLCLKIMDNKKEEYQKMLTNLNIKPSHPDLLEKDLMRDVMKQWLPAADAMLEMIILHLPSPLEAQKNRVECLYKGPTDDHIANAIRKCDPDGPLMVYISKQVPTKDMSRFIAFGRVFSGTIRTGDKINILGPNYEFGKKTDIFENVGVQGLNIMMGRVQEQIDECPAGNTIGIIGIDKYLLKSGTLTNDKSAYPIKNMKFSVSPVVRVAVDPILISELPKLVEGMRKLAKSDPCVQCFTLESGEHIIAGSGELHIEMCLNDLEKYYMKDTKGIKKSNPIVPYCETVIATSSQICLAKSPNKHNRLWFTAEPIDPELGLELEEGIAKNDKKAFIRLLVEKYQWDPESARKIWAIEPQYDCPNNMLVDATKGVQYLNEIKQHVETGFVGCVNKGVLAEEPLRNVRFNLKDVILHSDSIHRGPGQLLPTTRNVCYASILTAQPRLMEPIYLVEIQCPENAVGGVYSVLNKRRGSIISEERSVGSPLYNIKAYLPVAESFGFSTELRSQTSGKAFPQCIFDHWEIINSDPLEPGSKANEIVKAIRKRKGLSEDVLSLDQYLDKL